MQLIDTQVLGAGVWPDFSRILRGTINCLGHFLWRRLFHFSNSAVTMLHFNLYWYNCSQPPWLGKRSSVEPCLDVAINHLTKALEDLRLQLAASYPALRLHLAQPFLGEMALLHLTHSGRWLYVGQPFGGGGFTLTNHLGRVASLYPALWERSLHFT